ncbi:hypothetical protein QTN25_009762 [Entamoeba marina]
MVSENVVIPLVGNVEDDWLNNKDKRKWYQKIPLLPWHVKLYHPRTITYPIQKQRFVTNKISNANYSYWSFYQ